MPRRKDPQMGKKKDKQAGKKTKKQGGKLTGVNGIPYLNKPLSKKKITKMMHEDGEVKGNIVFDLPELMELDIDGHNQIACERLIGALCLQDIYYNIVDILGDGTHIVMEVSGWVDDEDLANFDYLRVPF